jgi:hypothetical protein
LCFFWFCFFPAFFNLTADVIYAHFSTVGQCDILNLKHFFWKKYIFAFLSPWILKMWIYFETLSRHAKVKKLFVNTVEATQCDYQPLTVIRKHRSRLLNITIHHLTINHVLLSFGYCYQFIMVPKRTFSSSNSLLLMHTLI